MATRPPIPNESISTHPRFAVVTAFNGDLDVVDTYGGPTRRVIVLGANAGASLNVKQSSPYDDTGTNDEQQIPAYQGLELPISVTVVYATTNALPLLLLF